MGLRTMRYWAGIIGATMEIGAGASGGACDCLHLSVGGLKSLKDHFRHAHSAQHLPPFLAEAFDFMQEIEDEFQPGVVHLAGRAQMLDAAELAQALSIEQRGVFSIAGGGTNETLLLVMEDGLGIDPRQLGDDLDGITRVGGLAINGKLMRVWRWIRVHGAVG